jgi:hypothetical protein
MMPVGLLLGGKCLTLIIHSFIYLILKTMQNVERKTEHKRSARQINPRPEGLTLPPSPMPPTHPSSQHRPHLHPSRQPSLFPPDSSKNLTNRRSHLGLANSTRTPPGFFPSHASVLAIRSLGFGEWSRTCDLVMWAEP